MRRPGRRAPAAIAGSGLKFVTLVAFAVFFATPVVWLVLATTKNAEQLQLGAPMSWGSIHQFISNFDRLTSINGDSYANWFGNSLEYTFTALFIVLLVDIPTGYALALGHMWWRRPLLVTTLVMMLIPNTVLVLPIFLELFRLHLIGNPFSLILPFSFFPFGVYLSYLYFSTSLPPDLLAAARVDGCSEVQAFLRVALPLAKPVIALVAFFSFVSNWNNYFLPLLVLPTSDGYPLQVGLVDLPRNSPILALGTLLSIVPVALVFIVAQRYVVRGLTAGSTTG